MEEEKDVNLENNEQPVEKEVEVKKEEVAITPEPQAEISNETPIVAEKTEAVEKTKEEKSKENSKLWKKILIIIAIIIIILMLLHFCGCGRRYQITLHYGDEEITVDQNFKITDLDVKGGEVTFLVDSSGNVVNPKDKLNPESEYSAHVIPEGKETVNVTYIIDKDSFAVKYQKGAGLLFPKDPVKKGYVFICWKFKDKDEYPIYMMPVNYDMTIVAIFEKEKSSGGKCEANCDTNKDGKCDLNCDTNGDGKADTNIDKDKDGKPDTNVTPGGKDSSKTPGQNNFCTLNCDTNNDGTPDTNIDKDGDGIADTNIDVNNDGKCDYNCDNNKDGKCDDNCEQPYIPTVDYNYKPVTYKCSDTFKLMIPARKELVVYTKINGKLVEGTSVLNGKFTVYDVEEYKGSGKTISFESKFIMMDDAGEKYYLVFTTKIKFEGNCPKDTSKTDTKETPKQDETNKTNQNQVAPTPSREEPSSDTTDNGTIRLTADGSCLLDWDSITITAEVYNAKDETVNWSGDACLTISGSGKSVIVTGNNCGYNPTVTATLNNGSSSTYTLTYEERLTFAVLDRYGDLAPYEMGAYVGNDLTVNTNVPGYITGRNLLGDEGSLRNSATTNGAAGSSVNISTVCGQSASLEIHAVIN